MRFPILASLTLRPLDQVTTQLFWALAWRRHITDFSTLSHTGQPEATQKHPVMFLWGEPWLIWCIGPNWGMRSCVGDLPAYLLAVARPHCTTHNDYMELCLGMVRLEDLDSSSLPVLCQIFSSQVKSRQPHDPQKYIAVPMVLSLWLHGTGVPHAMYAQSTVYITVLRNRSCQILLHTARW